MSDLIKRLWSKHFFYKKGANVISAYWKITLRVSSNFGIFWHPLISSNGGGGLKWGVSGQLDQTILIVGQFSWKLIWLVLTTYARCKIGFHGG